LKPDGLDIWPVLTNGAKSPHEAILLMGTVPGKAAVRMGDWKLLRNPSEVDAEDTDDKSATAGLELYNLAEDISESRNLAATNPEKLKELSARLDALLKDAVPPGEPAAAKAGKKKAKK
jgi:arylsulfatase A-like enzyme